MGSEVPSTIVLPVRGEKYDEALYFVFLSSVYGFNPLWPGFYLGPTWPCL